MFASVVLQLQAGVGSPGATASGSMFASMAAYEEPAQLLQVSGTGQVTACPYTGGRPACRPSLTDACPSGCTCVCGAAGAVGAGSPRLDYGQSGAVTGLVRQGAGSPVRGSVAGSVSRASSVVLEEQRDASTSPSAVVLQAQVSCRAADGGGCL